MSKSNGMGMDADDFMALLKGMTASKVDDKTVALRGAINGNRLAKLLMNKFAKSPPMPEAVIMTLREISDAFQKPCAHKVGDIVTAVNGRTYTLTGWPASVIEVRSPEDAIRNFVGENVTSTTYGRRLDMRIAQYAPDGDIIYFWVESVDYVAWDGKFPDKINPDAIPDED